MSGPGKYLYGLAYGEFTPGSDLRGLANAVVHTIEFQDIAAVVSDHPVEKLQLLRRNLEPHHRVIQESSRHSTFIPVTFGHISENEQEILQVLRNNYARIKDELTRLAGKAEMGVKLFWDVDNIFEYFVNRDQELKKRRDRIFGKSRVTLEEKLELGAFFEERLKQERERSASRLIEALQEVTSEVRVNTPTDEKMVLNAAFLIYREQEKTFEAVLYRAAGIFDSNFNLDYNGPWPPYNFVRLRLEIGAPEETTRG